MKLWFNPEIFNNIAISIAEYRWSLLIWSAFAFVLFFTLQYQIEQSTPLFLIWLAIFILFAALQALVVASFIFFFQALPSTKIQDEKWHKFYRTIEWCEAAIFSFILPLPTILFIYALFTL